MLKRFRVEGWYSKSRPRHAKKSVNRCARDLNFIPHVFTCFSVGRNVAGNSRCEDCVMIQVADDSGNTDHEFHVLWYKCYLVYVYF